MTRWMRGPELDRQREGDRFDPVTEGARYRLPPELSLAIWERVCTDATDSAGRRDLTQAQQRFHDIAARIAARGGRLRPDVGKLTRVGVESDSGLFQALHTHELATPTPGRQTLVAAEAHRRSALHAAIRTPGRQSLVTAEADRWPAAHDTPAVTADDIAPAPDPNELPGAAEVARAMAALQSQQPAPSANPSARPPASPELDPEPAGGSPLARDRRPRDNALPAVTLDRMEQAFGRRFDDVEIHADSPEVPVGQQAFTRENHIYLERGAVDLGELGRHRHRDEPPGRGGHNEHHDHVLAHELAHVVQQSRASEHGADRPPTRAALEADAHQAALSVLAGRAATVHLFAPPAAALGFSDGAPPHLTPQPRSTAPAAQAHAPSSAPAGHTPASQSSGAPTPPPTLRTTAFDRPAATQRPAAPVAAPIATATQRGRGGDGLLLPEAPGALSPAAAGRLQNIHAANQGVAGAITNLPTADHQTDVARGAVVEPQAEQDAHAQHGVVAAVDDRPPPSPEIVQACAHIREVIKAKRPPSEDKLVDAKPREMAQEAGNQMSDGVDQRAGTVRQGYADMQQNPQGTPSRTPVPATLPPGHVATPPVDAAAGAPDPLHQGDVSLDSDVAAQNKQIDDAGMNTEPAKLVKDGPIGDAHGGADDLEHMAKTDPQKVLADQAAAVAHAQGDMHALQAAAEKALAQARAGTVGHIATHTTGVKGSEEQQRAQAGAQMQAIFAQTQKSVDALLQPLSQDAVARWEAGVAQLSTAFETTLADVKRRIDERHHGHHGMFGGLEDAWDQAKDKVFSLPDWVTQDYDRAEAAFADGATSLITDISRDVNKVIEDCKALIQQARKDIEAIVHSLPASLQTWAQGEAQKLGQKLDQLSQHVDQTQHNLNQELIHRADSAVQQVREQVADLREQAKGLIGKIAHAIAEFAKNPAKAIINGLLSALGIPPDQFWSLVNQLGDVISAIAKDPVKFGKGLISGAGQGFKQFFEHFPTHLKEILMNWVFDTLGATGVPVPTDFSGPSIMSTVLAIVGIDTPMVTAMLGGEISDPDEAAEAHKELAGVLSGDPKALVALLREEFDPASLLPMIKDAAISFLIQTVITKAAERIAALLVPGGAILTAVEAIFKVLQWVINNAARIFTLIQSLVGAAAQAVAGNISGVATAVEASLVQIIVVVIDFLAGYLGLGGLGGKLKGVLMKLSGKLKAALKKVLGAISKRAKARAKAKHHGNKHAPDAHHKNDDKPDATQHPKQDDRDPQKAKDDAKDPRNHQHDPEDKDPRNHDNDSDPKKRKDHDDDSDPKKHKDQDDDSDPKRRKNHDDDSDPKRRTEDDESEARRRKEDEDRQARRRKEDDDLEAKKRKQHDDRDPSKRNHGDHDRKDHAADDDEARRRAEERQKEDDDADKQRRLARGLRIARRRIHDLVRRGIARSALQRDLPGIASAAGLTRLWLVTSGSSWAVRGQVNPDGEADGGVTAEGAKLFAAKESAQAVVLDDAAIRARAEHFQGEFSSQRRRENPPPIPLRSAEDRLAAGSIFEDGDAGHRVKVTIGSVNTPIPTTFSQLGRNSIRVEHAGSSLTIFRRLSQGAKRLGMTEEQLMREMDNFAHTGELDERILRDRVLANTIAREIFRQDAVEPRRIPTHLADRAGSLDRAGRPGATIGALKTPADIARRPGENSGAAAGHREAAAAVRRHESGEPEPPNNNMDTRAGKLVLQAVNKEAEQLDGKLFEDQAALVDMLVRNIRRRILGTEP